MVYQRMIPGLLLVLGLFFGASNAVAVEYPWKLRVKEDGITVYTRRVEGAPIQEFKADMVINAPLDKVLALFEDEKKAPEWYHQCTKAELVEDNGPNDKVLHFVIHLPWPVAERDSVFRRTRMTDPKTGVVTYSAEALAQRLPKEKGKIRVLFLKTFWRFTSLDGGKTEVFFQQHSNPGGSIPASIVNKLVVEIPFNSFRAFRKELEGQKI